MAARLQEDIRKGIYAGAMTKTLIAKMTGKTRSLAVLIVFTLRLFDNVLALNPFFWHVSS